MKVCSTFPIPDTAGLFQIAVVRENATFSSCVVICPDNENEEKAK